MLDHVSTTEHAPQGNAHQPGAALTHKIIININGNTPCKNGEKACTIHMCMDGANTRCSFGEK